MNKKPSTMRHTTLLLTLTTIFFMIEILAGCAANANKTEADKIISDNGGMPVYVIEREIPGAGTLSPQQLKAISEKSCGVLKEMGKGIKWMHSYVTDDKI